MATGRADFWYGRPFIVVDVPVDGDSEDAPTANWAYNHAVNPSAHHVRYSDAEAVLAMGTIGDLNTLRHNRYSGGEAQEAMGVKANYNPFHHDRYTDSEADARIAAIWPIYTDRGDPIWADFETNAFVKDNTWRDLNLSDIVPSGGKGVVLSVYVQTTAAPAELRFKKKGVMDNWTFAGMATQIADVPVIQVLTVSLDSNRYIQYRAGNFTWTYIYVTVLGWFK